MQQMNQLSQTNGLQLLKLLTLTKYLVNDNADNIKGHEKREYNIDLDFITKGNLLS